MTSAGRCGNTLARFVRRPLLHMYLIALLVNTLLVLQLCHNHGLAPANRTDKSEGFVQINMQSSLYGCKMSVLGNASIVIVQGQKKAPTKLEGLLLSCRQMWKI